MSELETEAGRVAGFSLRPRLRIVETDERALVSDTRPECGLAWAKRYRSGLLITDTAIIFAALLIALLGRLAGMTPSSAQMNPPFWMVCACVLLTWNAALAAFHTRDLRVVGVGLNEYKQVVSASFVTFGLLAMAFMILEIDTARHYLVVSFPLGAAALVGSRLLWRKWLIRQRRFGHFLSQVVVAGKRRDVGYVVRAIEKNSGAAYKVVGTVLDEHRTGDASDNLPGIPTCYGLRNVAEVTAALGADAVIVASHPSEEGNFIRSLAWQLEGTATELILASRLVDVAGPRIHFRPVEGLPLIHVEIPAFDGGKHVLKRVLDVIVSAIGIAIVLPLCAVLSILIACDSPGGVFFRQERVGRDGRTFTMLKFRSMCQTATQDLAALRERNEGAGVLFKIKDDPRVTRVGRTLRKYSLDELPQLWNILKGDMSLVGPRPPLPSEVDDYEEPMGRRLYIKPGLTGMWQVNGRSDLSWQESVRLDLYYVENWSLIGDLVILWRTLKVLTHPVGAY
ncbi:sugar transferase [Parafrigoribacterium mesophilum]|uniref:sugar transferase n=1 Tax=Parafrigoribacterium mesophilum TaxID=433646 RepID=UPI0031FCFA38